MSTMPGFDPNMYQPTGSSLPTSHTVTRTLGQYEVQVELSQDERLLDIVEISVRKDFRSQKQRIESRGAHDVLDIYEAEG